jgi:hypothetical protein
MVFGNHSAMCLPIKATDKFTIVENAADITRNSSSFRGSFTCASAMLNSLAIAGRLW